MTDKPLLGAGGAPSDIPQRTSNTAADSFGIDSTPALPEPSAECIQAAQDAIPEVLCDVEPGSDNEIGLVAAELVRRIEDKHSRAAAKWAIHNAIKDGRLRVGRIEYPLPTILRPTPNGVVSEGGGKGYSSIPKGQRTPFEAFKVIATELLWASWKQRPSSGRCVTPDDHLPAVQAPLSGSPEGGDAESSASASQFDRPHEERRKERLENLRPSHRQAYLAFEFAESKKERRLTDKAAYEFLEDEGIPEDAQGLADYQLPREFSNWSRYLREARKAMGEQKHERHHGRPHGRSMVGQDEI